ncbi:hypothetical protein LMG28614_05679 [Paraburkholderia ultramafica]|uniref:Uncharacterized protein n=1 Tax=Paraburkholderia ultramafica TaxID=1544867 RepID=A0A6S7BJQ4_9BURK|nr:hypothetical protein [Paraburkholderia ultramafica]CAB3802713.1 hypothetical protein LMG28614_05679 [Paraburkholderia ultramafica]
MLKRRLTRAFLDWTSEWNEEIHNAIESKVFEEYGRMFPKGTVDADATIRGMREFYYARISNTANLAVAIVALLVAFVSLIVAAIALFKG